MKNSLLFSLFFFQKTVLFFLIVSPFFLEATEKKETLSQKEIKEYQSALDKAEQFFAENSLYPFIKPGKLKLQPTSLIEKKGKVPQCLLTQVVQGDSSFHCMFAITDKAKLLYITDDRPISPELATDVCKAASPHIPTSFTHFNVAIFKTEGKILPKNSRSQQWFFFDGKQYWDISVLLTDDGSGGTYFSITR